VADRGYRGHNGPARPQPEGLHLRPKARRHRGDRRDLRRRSAVEPVIGHAAWAATSSMGLTVTPPTPSSRPPATTSEGSWPGSPPFGAPLSWRSSSQPWTTTSLRPPAPEAQAATPRLPTVVRRRLVNGDSVANHGYFTVDKYLVRAGIVAAARSLRQPGYSDASIRLAADCCPLYDLS
jgi:hypothetical protein